MCSRCGACCRNLNKSELFDEFHNGDGICAYLDKSSNLCSIYDVRPLLCSVDRAYDEFFTHLPRDEYYELNYKACEFIQKLESQKANSPQ